MRLRTDPTTGVSLLARVERAFSCLKTVDLDIRPIRHWTAERVRAHVFLCMLAYHVE
jgi:transposase